MFKKWEEEVPKFGPNFQISSNVRRANELLIESLLKKRVKPTISSFF